MGNNRTCPWPSLPRQPRPRMESAQLVILGGRLRASLPDHHPPCRHVSGQGNSHQPENPLPQLCRPRCRRVARHKRRASPHRIDGPSTPLSHGPAFAGDMVRTELCLIRKILLGSSLFTCLRIGPLRLLARHPCFPRDRRLDCLRLVEASTPLHPLVPDLYRNLLDWLATRPSPRPWSAEQHDRPHLARAAYPHRPGARLSAASCRTASRMDPRPHLHLDPPLDSSRLSTNPNPCHRDHLDRPCSDRLPPLFKFPHLAMDDVWHPARSPHAV